MIEDHICQLCDHRGPEVDWHDGAWLCRDGDACVRRWELKRTGQAREEQKRREQLAVETATRPDAWDDEI
jgi:hypothetical protein